MSAENQAPPAQSPAQPEDNSTIRQMREELQAREAELAQERAEKEELKRAQMTEAERLQAERDSAISTANDLKPLAEKVKHLESQLEAYDGEFKARYEGLLAQAPESAREKLAQISANGSFADRFRVLETAVGLIVEAKPATGSAGSAPAPGAPGAPRLNLKNVSLGGALQNTGS